MCDRRQCRLVSFSPSERINELELRNIFDTCRRVLMFRYRQSRSGKPSRHVQSSSRSSGLCVRFWCVCGCGSVFSYILATSPYIAPSKNTPLQLHLHPLFISTLPSFLNPLLFSSLITFTSYFGLSF